MNTGLAGKVVVVTGGGSNVGRGISLAFAQEGSTVVIADIDEAQAHKTELKAREAGARAVVVMKTDVTKYGEVEAMTKQVVEKFQRIDVLVNNAGGRNVEQSLLDKSLEQCEKEMALNFWSVVNCVKAIVPYMIEQRQGRIINIASDAALLALPRHAFYAGVKGGVITMSRSLARDLGPYGITVNIVSPGAIIPRDVDEEVGKESSWSREIGLANKLLTQRWQEKVSAANPVRRVGRPSDIANVVIFFASEASDYISGQTISVSGGNTIP